MLLNLDQKESNQLLLRQGNFIIIKPHHSIPQAIKSVAVRQESQEKEEAETKSR